MHAAAGSGRETVKTILAPDKSGRTPLGLALSYTGMQFGDKITTGEAIMRFALENGVDWRTLIDIKDAALRLKLKEIFYEQIICDSRIWPRLYPSQSRWVNQFKLTILVTDIDLYSVALSASTRSRTNERSNLSQLQDEILVMIFEYLDVLDLNNCEMVCLRWRNILSSKIIWRKLHSRMVSHSFRWLRTG